MAFVYLILFVGTLLLIYEKDKTLLVPPTIVAVTWTLFPGIASVGVLDIYPFSFKTHLIIILSFASFMLGYYLKFPKIRILNKKEIARDNRKEIAHDNNSLKFEAGYVNYTLLILVNLLISFWLLSHLAASISIIQSKGYHALRAVYQETFSSSTIVNIIYGWFAKPFVIASTAIVVYDILYRKQRKQIILLICVIMNVLFDTFLFAARATLVKFLVYLFLAFLFCKRRMFTVKQIILVLFITILGMMIISYVTSERSKGVSNLSSTVNTFSIYYFAPFGLLNYYVVNPGFSNLGFANLLFGKNTFGFAFNIFASVLYVLFNLNYIGSDYINNQVIQQFVYIGPHLRVNAECTAAYIFMRDFSYLGIVIGFAGMAVFCKSIRNRFIQNPTIRNGAIYIIVLYVVFRLVSNYDFLSPATFFSIIFVLISTKQFFKVKTRE